MGLNSKQLEAVRYYIGDVSGNDPFWGSGKAYLVLNSLFYPGISTESARAAEKKYLEPEILADTERLVGLLTDLLSAFTPAGREIMCCRVERAADYAQMKSAGRTLSFTSTSTAGFLSAYQDRLGIALMEFEITPDCPCIDMAQALESYAKPDEQEVLLPPFLGLNITELPLTQEHMRITDAAGQPPELFCHAIPYVMPCNAEPETLPVGGNEAGMRVLKALNSGTAPEKDDVELYVKWKSALVSILCSTAAAFTLDFSAGI
ncbi:MAG: hypothetical protein IJ874_02390 [Ruminococcus sp.]|nr:hypothetical protein [Ruminococcus sp.]